MSCKNIIQSVSFHLFKPYIGNVTFCPQTAFADIVSIGLEQLVEDVVGPLHLLLLSDTGLLKQVGHDVATAELTRGSEVDTDKLSEPRQMFQQVQKCLSIHNQPGRVVVPRGFGISVGLQNWVGGHNLVLKRHLLLDLLAASSSSCHHGQVGDHLLGVLSLSGTGLSSDKHRIVLMSEWIEANTTGLGEILPSYWPACSCRQPQQSPRDGVAPV